MKKNNNNEASGYIAIRNDEPGGRVIKFANAEERRQLSTKYNNVSHRFFNLSERDDAEIWAENSRIKNPISKKHIEKDLLEKTEQKSEDSNTEKVKAPKKFCTKQDLDYSCNFGSFVSIIRDYILQSNKPAFVKLDRGTEQDAFLTIYPSEYNLGIVRNECWICCRDANDNKIAVNMNSISGISLASRG